MTGGMARRLTEPMLGPEAEGKASVGALEVDAADVELLHTPICCARYDRRTMPPLCHLIHSQLAAIPLEQKGGKGGNGTLAKQRTN